MIIMEEILQFRQYMYACINNMMLTSDTNPLLI